MSAVDEILNAVPIDQLASEVGSDPAQTEQAARQAVSALLGGMSANADDEGGARSLATAVQQHENSPVVAGDGGTFKLQAVDTADGEKIVSNVFGDNTEAVVQRLGGSGGQQDLINKLLPILAPIVLAYLAKKVQGTKYGDLLGPILAGAAGGTAVGPLQDILGQVLGGKDPQPPAGQPAPGQPAPNAPAPEQTAPEPAQQSGPIPGGILGGLLNDLLGGGRRS
ncbi:hypothetical protein GGQ54_000781 [Naumannella cuiyingiana]|uniref:DUF937 domain-containing protein n=1 Tax=Naumannella cuiyingiana TaxID=1347891 RepID=A0A7Z0IK72_9ACTN|nr:hypothetical protein [Naumannella cuiyingiana]